MRRTSRILRLLFCITPLVLVGCPDKEVRKDDPANPPPPPSNTAAQAGACASGGGEVKDPVSAQYFPRAVSGFCLDPQGETKTYGDNAAHPKEEVCTTLFDGECEVYIGYKLTRVVALRYVDGAGKGATVDVYLSTFADTNGSYGMFTKRVIADSDPAEESAPKAIPAGGAAVMGTGRAYVWKGQYLAELQYNNEQESPKELAKSSAAILPALAKEIGTRVPGSPDKPPSAKALPEASLVSPAAIQYVMKEPLGAKGVGPAAIGFYKDATKRWRLVSIAATDADQAKDVMKTFAKRPEALPIAGLGDEAAYVVIKEGDRKTEYAFARKGSLVGAAGDDEYAKPEEKLTKDEKIAKVRAWLTGAAPAPASSASADAGKK